VLSCVIRVILELKLRKGVREMKRVKMYNLEELQKNQEVNEMTPTVTEQKRITTAAEEAGIERKERIMSVLARAADDSRKR
jgi:hypothetical protein